MASGSQKTSASQEIIHASTVAWQGNALLILGKSGSGKSTLALDLISLGADLVADDRTALCLSAGHLQAAAPSAIAGLIEARFVGILLLPHVESAKVALAIDLDSEESHRLPPARFKSILGRSVPLIHRPPRKTPVSALLQCMMLRRDTP